MDKIAEVKKLNDGLYVRWEGKRKFVKVEDPELTLFIIFHMTLSEEERKAPRRVYQGTAINA